MSFIILDDTNDLWQGIRVVDIPLDRSTHTHTHTHTHAHNTDLHPAVCTDCRQLKNPVHFLPCFWPHAIILGTPCGCLGQQCYIKSTADAHRLVLLEKSLEHTVDKYNMLGDARNGFIPCCMLCGAADRGPIHEVYVMILFMSGFVLCCYERTYGFCGLLPLALLLLFLLLTVCCTNTGLTAYLTGNAYGGRSCCHV